MHQIKSYGKFNLFLKVCKKRKNEELHRIKSLMVPYKKLYDEITITESAQFHFIEKKNVLNKRNNTVIEAIKYFFTEHPTVNKRITVELVKNSPIGSGLGYSASNAIATYKLLHEFYEIKMEDMEAFKFAKLVANDATFFLYETPLWVSHDGSAIKPFLKKMDYARFDVVLNPDISCITQKVYEQFDRNYKYYVHNFVKHSDFYNYLELPCLDLYPMLYERYEIVRHKYQHVMISGSGSSFICFDDD